MEKKLAKKLKELPKTPGIYFHKDKKGQIMYVGKAANLRNRVRQYFQNSRSRDPKTDVLIAEIADIDWITVDSEIDALFLEAELVRRYLPRYNILLRDDKSSAFVRIDYGSSHPTVTLTRRPLDDGAKYFGPYFSAGALRRALKFLRKAFPYSTHFNSVPQRACLLFHLGLCPGLEEGKISLTDYRANLRKLIQYLKGGRVRLLRQIEKEMTAYARANRFEKAAQSRNQLFALRSLSKQIIFSDKEFLDISKDEGLNDLAKLLSLSEAPRVIDGFDISHMSGTDTTASLVVFTNGIPDKARYRKFKMRLLGNDDFAHMHEVISRRFSEKNRQAWGIPDLLLIDGGKGQLTAAIRALSELELSVPAIGLAKREEEIIVKKSVAELQLNSTLAHKLGGFVKDSGDFSIVSLPDSSHIVKLLQRIRDESHRFAVSYHTALKVKRQTASRLEDIPTIGPATRKKLIKTFGSLKGVLQARKEELEHTIGFKKASVLRQHLRHLK